MRKAFIKPTRPTGSLAHKPKPREPLERDISKAVKMLLELDGWRVYHMEPLRNVKQGRYSSELGAPDLLAIRYMDPADFEEWEKRTWAQVLWLEIKRRGKKPAPHQADWHARERALGAEVQVVDNYDVFRMWYLGSGLNRGIRA